jgi:CheY-like chemotaxis protein
VLHALGGRIGLAMASHYMPDVIVLDVQMPEMDSLEVCRRLRQNAQTAHIPVVIMTVQRDAEAVLKGVELGAVDFIPKDAFCHRVLRETLRHLGILDDEQAPARKEAEPIESQLWHPRYDKSPSKGVERG